MLRERALALPETRQTQPRNARSCAGLDPKSFVTTDRHRHNAAVLARAPTNAILGGERQY